jgi:hypothetical protein
VLLKALVSVAPVSACYRLYRDTGVLYYIREMSDCCINRSDTIRAAGVPVDSKLHFHAHVDCMFSQLLRMLGLVRILPYYFLRFIAYQCRI